MVGKPFESRGKRTANFRVVSRSEGMMVGICTKFSNFVRKYPGTGSHGVTAKEMDTEIYSICYYKEAKPGDIIFMEVDFEGFEVYFYHQTGNLKNFTGSSEIPEAHRRAKWTMLVSLCSVGETISIYKHHPTL